ncbi:outer membrane homotrimeric porin [Desulfonatronovibrio hydrogenovorans]|uniref:outer membrane homotrimeric porin n=1 Tax=Desulfonatronovibrio hydrogenovorans TaxID=53245 RepID=UPI00048B4A4E|nr:outer membrane homotrimeric porin [Desulfonatronovibrio hydrogenovorans]
MKRFIVMAVMAAFILGTVGMAQAVQINAKGDWQMSGNYVKNPNFDKDEKDDRFQAVQRLRTAFEFVANENLKAVFRFHVENRWGEEGHTTGVSGRDKLGYDLAYLDFMIPNTDVNLKVGKQAVALPNTLGSHILDEFVYGVTAGTQFNDMVGLTLGWSRFMDEEGSGYDQSGNRRYSKDELDVFFAIVPVTMDGFQVNPFVAYGYSGKNAFADIDADETYADWNGESANHYWLGINATVDMFDPIVVMADLNYGGRGEIARNADDEKMGETRGWIANLAVQYNMDLFTPQVFFLYESGESRSSMEDGKKGKRMPTLIPDVNFTSFGFNGSNFRGVGRNRIAGLADDDHMATLGVMGAGFKLMDISFVENLTHEFQFAYYRGTNHKDYRNVDPDEYILMTSKDKAWEVNFNTQYQMYENLAAILELGYINADFADRRDGDNKVKVLDDDAWKAAFGFRYRF